MKAFTGKHTEPVEILDSGPYLGEELLMHPWGYLVRGYKGWANGHDHLRQENHTLLVVDRTQMRYGSLMLYIVIRASSTPNVNTFDIKGSITCML